ncbi:2-oxoglutarate and iron-dependent oxygenase domain-containing protein [Limibacillus sp. MBR-115]|jgi:isopenicillin N synthase-like dioxygenase|uniref:isopenicillin N synthase family dioxygenase n=1 Tax=Limibacillus sp. MBR-115 TaxID=3156465 RepID=UPI003390AC28
MMTRDPMLSLPVIDMTPLFGDDDKARQQVARAIDTACRKVGFFYVVGHAIPSQCLTDLEAESRAFFALPLTEKMQVAMARGGAAWRGYFPVGNELTSGKPDNKEGLYFGSDLPNDHPRVRGGWPLHGANLWPSKPAGLRNAVETYMTATTRAGQALLEGISLSLGLDRHYFLNTYTANPTVLFRVFHYPAEMPESWRESWGAGAHCDYGLLTLLAQDRYGGLEVKTPNGWIQAPPIEGALVCNIGDMLERLTGGTYRSTLHRVMNRSGHDRLSFPLFLDPDFAAEIVPLPRLARDHIDAPRWDGEDPHTFSGRYGDYLLSKVAKVFPTLGADHLEHGTTVSPEHQSKDFRPQ